MAGRKIKDEVDALECLDAAAHSGVSRTEWAHRSGVDARSLNAWHMNLARRGSSEARELRLVELVPRPAKVSPPLVLRCGAWCVEVRADSDLALLAEVLEVVEAC